MAARTLFKIIALLALSVSGFGQINGGGGSGIASRLTTGSGVPSTGCTVAGNVGKVYLQINVQASTSPLYLCSKTGVSSFGWVNSGTSSGGSGTVTNFAGSGPSWLTWTVTSPTTAVSASLAPTTAQTSHQVIGTCGAGTTFAPCSLVAGDLPTTTVNSVVNDTNITGSISGQALTFGWAGALAAARLNANVVQAVTNDTNITGSISAQNLTFAWSGTLAAARMVNAGVHTGDCTTTFPACTISAGAISLTKMANLAANSIMGNNTGSPATPLALTAAQVATMLNTQALFTLTTTGSSGAATYSGGTLNIPQYSGGGSANSVFTGSTATNPAFSATPTFSLADVSVKSPMRVEPGALTANVTSVTFTNKTAGAKFSLAWTQDGTGGRTVSYGASATNTCAIDTTASATTTQFLEVGADGSTVNGTGCVSTVADTSGPEISKPGTPPASTGVCWWDSTNHVRSCMDNNSSTVSNTVVPDTGASNNFLTAISAGGVITKAQPTILNLATFSSANLATQLTDESGTGVVCFTVSCAMTTPNLGTPTALVLTNATGLPVAGGGTGASTLAAHGPLVGEGTSAIVATSPGTSGQCYLSNGASSDPSFQACPGGAGAGNSVTSTTPVTVNTNTTSDQQLMELSLGAGYFNSSKQPFLFDGAGVYTTQTAQTPTITLKIKLCTVSGCGSGTVVTLISIVSTATVAAVTNNNWNLSVLGYTATTGTTGNLEIHGPLAVDLGALTTTADSIFVDTNTAVSSNIDLTAALFVDFTIAFSTNAATANTFSQRSGGVMPFAATAAPVTSVNLDGGGAQTGAVTLTSKVTSVNTLTGAVALFATNAQTATYQVLAGDFSACKTIPIASGTFTITLVASGSQPPSGQCVKFINYGSGVVTIARSGQNINGGTASYIMQSGSATNPSEAAVFSDGTNYFIGGGFTNPMTTAGDLIYAGTTGLPTRLATGTAKQILVAGTTPSYIDFPERFMVPAANCNNTTAGAGWSIGSGGTATCRGGTNNLGGFVSITDTSSTFAQFTLSLPTDWDSGTRPYILVGFESATDTTNGHTVIPEVAVSCPTAINGTVSDDATLSAYQSLTTVTFGASAVAHGFYTTSVQIGSTQMTGCVAGGLMIVSLGRATDTATGVIGFYYANVTFPRLLAVQAN